MPRDTRDTLRPVRPSLTYLIERSPHSLTRRPYRQPWGATAPQTSRRLARRRGLALPLAAGEDAGGFEPHAEVAVCRVRFNGGVAGMSAEGGDAAECLPTNPRIGVAARLLEERAELVTVRARDGVDDASAY